MICPKCHAEYREGFTRCSDCGVDLVVTLPPGVERDLPLGDSKSLGHFLAWFVPMAVFYLGTLLLVTVPDLSKNQSVVFFVVVWFSIGPLGAYWMLYQVIRFERKVFPLVIFAFVPYAFIWYYLERYRQRREVDRVRLALR